VTEPLSSWNQGPAPGRHHWIREARAAVWAARRLYRSKSGCRSLTTTALWCEKAMPVQRDVIVRRLVEMAQLGESLRRRQPWKATYEKDYGWLGAGLDEHYAGDDTMAMTLAAGVLATYDGICVEASRPCQTRSFHRLSTRAWLAATCRPHSCRWSSRCPTWRRTD
jgi:hypothetical protein